jgi:hypothetical protein
MKILSSQSFLIMLVAALAAACTKSEPTTDNRQLTTDN